MFAIDSDIYEHIPCGVLILNRQDSTCVFANAFARDLLQVQNTQQCTWQQLLEVSNSELLHNRLDNSLQEIYTLPNNRFFRVTQQVYQKDYILISLLDCTSEYQFKNELVEFCYIASHDLQEPLRKIDAFGSRLDALNDSMSAQAADYLKRMRSATNRLQLMLDGLLQYSRVNQSEEFSPELNLSKALRKAILLAEQSNIKLSVEIPEDENIDFKNSPDQLVFLFHEIVSNAIKFDASAIAINCKITSEIIITIQDNGIGMNTVDLPKIFKLFGKLNGWSKYDGAGLGLAICHKIVKNHKGSIQVQSEVGIGSLFIITLPIK